MYKSPQLRPHYVQNKKLKDNGCLFLTVNIRLLLTKVYYRKVKANSYITWHFQNIFTFTNSTK